MSLVSQDAFLIAAHSIAHWALAFRTTAGIAIIRKARPSGPQINWSSAECDSTSRQNTDWSYIKPRFGFMWSTILISGLVHSSIHLILYNGLTLWLCVVLSPHCVFSTAFYHGEYSGERFYLLRAAEFSNRTVRPKTKYHPYLLPRAMQLWNSLPVAVSRRVTT